MTDPVPPDTCRLILIRHGQTDDNLVWRLSGWTDSPLNETGQRQARLLAQHLARGWRVDALYASPLQRAADTACTISEALGLDPVHHDGLREMHFGLCEGLTDWERQERFPDVHLRSRDETDPAFCWPQGESRAGFYERVRRVVAALAEQHPGQAVCVVGHGGFISTYLTHLADEPMGTWRRYLVDNCSLSLVTVDARTTPFRARLDVFNDTAHLCREGESGGVGEGAYRHFSSPPLPLRRGDRSV